ncbi:hypothetical protein MTO96_015766 [Rhipicephalus appendiculatus]
MSRKWLQLYQAFSCSAVLVPNVSPQGVCHEVWRRLYAGLTEQLKQDIGYVDAMVELLASASSCLPSSQSATNGLSPSKLSASPNSPRRWGLRQQRGSALGDLQPYCQALAWALDAVASHQLLPNESRQSVASIVGKLVRPVQDLLSSLHGMPALAEVVTLLGPALSKLLARGSGYASKVEHVWVALCGALSSQCTSGPRDDSLLCALTPLLEVALGYSRGQVHDRAVHLWQSLFAHSPGLHVQPKLRELLRKVKPSLVPYVEPEASEICEPASFSQDSLVPDACLPTTPQKKEALSFSPLLSSKNRSTPPSGSSTTHPTVVRLRTPQRATQSPRKRRSLYDFRAEEFVKVVSPIKKKQVLTEHQKEVRKERRSLPALYSNLSQSGLDSQDSETPQESEEMDDEPFTGEKNQTVEPMPVIVLDSDSEENGMPPEGPPMAQEVCCTPPPLQTLHPPNTTNGDVVPETQQDSALFHTSVETLKGQKPRKTDCPSNPVSGGSPRVHHPRARLSFTRPPAPEECEALGDTDVVPSSQSSVGSVEEVEMAKLGQDKPLTDPHPDSPVTVWLQDKERGRLIASQEASPAKHPRSSKTLVHEDGDELLEDGIAPLDDHVPANSVPAEQNIEEHTEEACTTQESTDTEIYEDELEGEREVADDVEPSSPAPTNSEECMLRLSEGSSACYSESTVQASQASPEFGAPLPSSDNRVELAGDTEEQIASVCTEADAHENVSAIHSCADVCTVPETEDQVATESWEPKSVTDTASKPELAQGKAVRGARKRKLPSQTTSPISSRLRAKQVRQEQVQRSSSPPPDAAGGKPPPRWSGSSPALSRSRIMLDAAMRSVGSSPSRHVANVPCVQQPADDGNGAGPPLSILKRRPPAEEGSPQGSPHRTKQVSSGRHVSFADPLVQGEYEIRPRKSRISRALYEDSEMEEGELANSQQPLWSPLEGSTDPVEAVLPLLTSSLWQRSLGRKLRLQGITTVGALASMTCAQALQLPVRAPRVASLRKALEQYSPLSECNSASLELPVDSEVSASSESTASLAPTENGIAADVSLEEEALNDEATEMPWTQAPPASSQVLIFTCHRIS